MGALVVPTPRGRGSQLAAGAEASRAPLLCFQAPDVRLPDETLACLTELALARPPCAFTFRLSVEGSGMRFRIVERCAALRSRLGIPFGDQGLVVRREDHERAGGFPDLSYLEDVVIAHALRGVTRLHLLPERVRSPGARWRREGLARSTLGHAWILLRLLAGTSPEALGSRHDRRRP